MLSAAASLAWLADVLRAREADLLEPLGTAVNSRAPSSSSLTLSGERTPLNDAKASGAFVGLRADTSRSHIVQAVLESVAFAARDNLVALAAAGTHLSELELVGGGSRSPLWTQIVADVLGLPVHRVEGEVGGALGAARLGRLADTGEAPAVVCTRPCRLATCLPRPAQVAAYEEFYTQWSRLYPALKEVSR
jgi:xylulokinase